VLVGWWRLVAFMKATNLLHWAMRGYSTAASRWPSKWPSKWVHVHNDCRPGGHRGDTKRVVAQWRRPVASGKALVMLHWVMRSVLHRRTDMAIEMARDGGAFVRRRRLFLLQ
jgi:hypothetical protein